MEDSLGLGQRGYIKKEASLYWIHCKKWLQDGISKNSKSNSKKSQIPNSQISFPISRADIGLHKNRSRHDKSMKPSEYDLYTSRMDFRCGTTMKYYCMLRYLTSFLFSHYKCHRGENGYFKFEDIAMRIADVVIDIETTNFFIACSL